MICRTATCTRACSNCRRRPGPAARPPPEPFLKRFLCAGNFHASVIEARAAADDVCRGGTQRGGGAPVPRRLAPSSFGDGDDSLAHTAADFGPADHLAQ